MQLKGRETGPKAKGPEVDVLSALKKGFFQQVRFLLKFGVSANQRDHNGATALILLASIKQQDWAVGLARTLLENRAKAGICDRQGRNALHHAALHGRQSLIAVYLRALDFRLNAVDKSGATPLMLSCRRGHTDCVRLLVDAHTRYKVSLNDADIRGMTPLMEAWSHGHVQCAQILKVAGADMDTHTDIVRGFSARDWERAYHESQSAAETLNTPSGSSMSTRTSLALPQTKSAQSTAGGVYLTTLKSRPSTGRLRPKSSIGPRTSTGSLRHIDRRSARARTAISMIDSEEKADVITDAGRKHLHNQPRLIFQTPASECFAPPDKSPLTHHLPSAPGASPPVTEHTWKSQLLRLYTAFEFQCTPSFKPAAIYVVEPDPSTVSQQDDYQSDDGSTTVSRKSRRASRLSKDSTKEPGELLKRKMSSASLKARRTSSSSSFKS